MTSCIGHQQQWEYLQALSRGSRLPQALIFSGPSDIGKFLVAWEWAGDLLLRSEGVAQHANIDSDRWVLEPELVTTKGVTRERDIPVEAIRDAIKKGSLSPSVGQYRIVIIRDAHRLTEKSQNALLKTLEEPPEHLILLLVTHRIGRLLPTVLSRCQVIDFHLVPEMIMRSSIPTTGAVPDTVWRLGRPELVRQFLDSPARFTRELSLLDQLLQIGTSSVSERLKLSEALSKDVRRTTRLLEWWLTVRRHQAVQGAMLAAWPSVGLISDTQQQLENQSKSVRLLLDLLFLKHESL
jgi:DNA polymerase-3 subunit delta'